MAVTATGVLPVYPVDVLAVQMLPDLDFRTAALGSLVGGFFGCSAVGAPFPGRLARHADNAAVMRAAALVSAACLLAVAALVSSAGALAVTLAIRGLAKSVGQPASNGLIAAAVRLHRQASRTAQAAPHPDQRLFGAR